MCDFLVQHFGSVFCVLSSLGEHIYNKFSLIAVYDSLQFNAPLFRVLQLRVTLVCVYSLIVFCILRVAPLTGKEVSWFVLSPLLSVDTLRFASEG